MNLIKFKNRKIHKEYLKIGIIPYFKLSLQLGLKKLFRHMRLFKIMKIIMYVIISKIKEVVILVNFNLLLNIKKVFCQFMICQKSNKTKN